MKSLSKLIIGLFFVATLPNTLSAQADGADVEELKVSTIFVDEGMTMKRIRPRAKGRADRILKRSCHITVKVSEK